MVRSSDRVDAYLEVGRNRVFAGALDWPGWCRSGRDEEAALKALFESGPRYARVLQATSLEFQAPAQPSALVVVERLNGTPTTDFGAPDVAPSADSRPVDETEMRRLQMLLKACWMAFDAAVRAATGQELRKGPRGGGRELDSIIGHVLGAETGYLSKLGWKAQVTKDAGADEALNQTREAVLEGLTAGAGGQLPERGPRGGVHWGLRYFVRRASWHVLDHAWEIEDRIQPDR